MISNNVGKNKDCQLSFYFDVKIFNLFFLAKKISRPELRINELIPPKDKPNISPFNPQSAIKAR